MLCRRDLASALGTVGRLDDLRRTENAGFRIEDAVSLDILKEASGRASENVWEDEDESAILCGFLRTLGYLD